MLGNFSFVPDILIFGAGSWFVDDERSGVLLLANNDVSILCRARSGVFVKHPRVSLLTMFSLAKLYDELDPSGTYG